MSVISAIAQQRKKLLDGLDANGGDINLSIFEDFYPDEAHFIYELLQNAEDAGATEVSFELEPSLCSFEHNGSRHFDERDIRGITGIFNSNKKGQTDKIGKFGVGFKSVFVYTDTPTIYSKYHSFRISHLVLPEEVPPKPTLDGRTRFEFPFNSPKKSAEEAFAEVKAGLEQISETTLLFLPGIRYVKWRIGTAEGAVLRQEHSEFHIEMLKLADGVEVVSSHWLRFSRSLPAAETNEQLVGRVSTQNVAVAFELQRLTPSDFDSKKTLAEQMKVVPAKPGTVSVFFPAEKETSGLRFHLHAPFVPELSRASIKNSPENQPLFSQLAQLTAACLHTIRDLKLLTGEFLAVLPNNDEVLSERYAAIRSAVLKELKTEPLVPAHKGGHAAAEGLIQGPASLKSLLSPNDLALVTGRNDEPEWVIGTRRGSDQDRLLRCLGIEFLDLSGLKAFFEKNARDCDWDDAEASDAVISWVSGKSFEWLQSLYSQLFKHCKESRDFGHLDDVYFIKLTDGEIGTAAQSFFVTGEVEANDPHPRVDSAVYSCGTDSVQMEDAKRFLERLGVREPSEVDEVSLVLTKYKSSNASVDYETYAKDFVRMLALSETPNFKRDYKHIFDGARVLRGENVAVPRFLPASQIYLDEPYGATGLRLVYDLQAKPGRWPLSLSYMRMGIARERIATFAQWLGCQAEFDDLFVQAACSSNPNWAYLRTAPGQRWGNGIDRDYALSKSGEGLAKAKTVDASQLIWRAMCRTEKLHPSVLRACFQFTQSGGPHYSDSQLVVSLKELPWIPQGDDVFVKPSAADVSRLPPGFSFEAGYKWLDAIGFASESKKLAAEGKVKAERRSELGFKSDEDLERAQQFVQLPKEEQERILRESKFREEAVELPQRPLRNPELRHSRVSAQARNTPDKESVVRPRAVQIGAPEAKAEAKLYLADQYTNRNGQMICQACKGELPFKVPNGSYYFEAVEVLQLPGKRYREAYLALCPNHAAAYMYANSSREAIADIISAENSGEIEVMLGGRQTVIYFTSTHLADVKACLASENELETGG